MLTPRQKAAERKLAESFVTTVTVRGLLVFTEAEGRIYQEDRQVIGLSLQHHYATTLTLTS